MAFISAAQRELLVARLLPVINPPDGGVGARKIAGAICDWLEFDALPQIMVQIGIPVATAGGPTAQVGATTGMGKIK